MSTPELVVHTTDTRLSAAARGISLNEVQSAIPELELLCNRKIEAAENFANAAKLVALKSGIDAAVLSSYITSRCNDTLKKKESQAEQLCILFEENFS